MTSANEWFGKIKSRALSVKKTATTRFGELTETIDKKLKEAQDDLEKQRSKAEAVEHETQLKKWQSSVENPDGEFIPLPTPPSPTVSRTIPTLVSSLQASTSTKELPTVAHRKLKKSHAKKNGFLSTSAVSLDHETSSDERQRNKNEQKRDNRAEIMSCLNDIINEIANREFIEQCLNELVDIVSIPDGLMQKTASIMITEEDNLEIAHDTANSDLDNHLNLEQENSTSSNIESDQENIQTNISIDELPSVINLDNTSIADDVQETVTLETAHEEVSKSTHSNNEQSDSNDNDSSTPENEIQQVSNELEDSFNEFTISNIRTNLPIKKSPEPSFVLTDLNDLISNIENDADAEREELTSKQDFHILDETVNNITEQLNKLDTERDIFSSEPTSTLDDIQQEIPNEPVDNIDSTINEFLPNEINQNISSTRIEPEIVEKKRFSTVNYNLIPFETTINHINCSLTYIYLCTDDCKIFYAKLDVDNMNSPLKWMQHSDRAEQLVVSITNRTVWRLFNKRLYSSSDSSKFPPIGSHWNELKIGNGGSLLSMSINDQCGWCIKDDGTLWLMRMVDETYQSLNVMCPFSLNRIFCFSEKVAVTTNDGEILIRVGCTDDCPEGDGWIFVEHNFGPIDDFILLTTKNIIFIVDKKHHLWINQWSSDGGFFEVLCNDDSMIFNQRCLICVNSESLFITDCEERILSFSDCITGVQWKLIETNTRLQRLIGAFTTENFVWALTTDKMIRPSNGSILEKPAQAQYLTHASFVPDSCSQGTVLWTLDESCNIYVRANSENDTKWEQLDQSQFDWNRRLVHIVCNNSGVWAVDDRGCTHFRHGHMPASDRIYLNELSLLPPAWIPIPGTPKKHRGFSQIYCGPVDWMVYATDNKQTVYARVGINEENRIGTSWEPFEDCSALELAISEHTLWLLTSCGQIQCRENISITNPIGTRSTTLPGFFLSLTVSIDDSQVWALDSKRNLLKLDRLTVLLEK
ncbi:unnamed protein product [Rotaria magnacalcarata]|uniref:Uncharacterized protein n=4 Tax=Rotaria magnacalcarata TaxID=392030 RepID=A0A814U857_9BILA|nr:unnamed protein product [Rotaria magnacalcarata]